MSGSANSTPSSHDPCGCCERLVAQTPAEVANRPGLAAIAYRIGTHSQFKQSMLARLSAFTGLSTRADDDFSIALMDAWAMVADVLTFYQERIANESYLGTATERCSLLELSRLIGYEPRPGVAAGTFLAFTLESAPGSPEQAAQPAIIDIGTKVQSIPRPGEQPQTFETIEKIRAQAEWSAMRPRLTQPQALTASMPGVTLLGAAHNLRVGDDVLIAAGNDPAERALRRITGVTADAAASTTRLDLSPAKSFVSPSFTPEAMPSGAFLSTREALSAEFIEAQILRARWRQSDLAALAGAQNWSLTALQSNILKQTAAKPSLPAQTGIFAFRQRASVFGYNAPHWDSLPDSQRIGAYAPQYDGDGHLVVEVPKGADGKPLPNAAPIPVYKFVPPAFPSSWEGRTLKDDAGEEAQIDLDSVYPSIAPESWLALKSASAETVFRISQTGEVWRSDFTISGKVTRLTVDASAEFGRFALRETTVLAQSESLPLAELPVEEPVAGAIIALDRIYLGLQAGQKACLSGVRADLPGVRQSEVLTLADVMLTAGYTTLILQQALTFSYVRDTVTINANVALATHGETVREVLGSGDGSQAHQRFTLQQAPLTYIGAATASGAESTLQVSVNGLMWRQAPTLYGAGPGDRVFVAHTGDDGKTAIQFGNGVTGARLPSGLENVQAVYRKGAGAAGNLEAGQLSLLLTRPLGVRNVVNPLPASGGADPESRDDVRRNAPLTVLTLDRIVSLQDYEDFARAFAGIAKALATWTWRGHTRGVFITVAGPGGAEVSADSPVYANLLAAIRQAADPHVPVQVQSYRKAFFKISTRVAAACDRRLEDVLAAVKQTLRSQFSFDKRAFGEPVAMSEVMAAIQSTPGVVGVEIDRLARTDGLGGDGRQQPIPAAFPQSAANMAMTAAELLTLDPGSPEITGAVQ